MYHISEIGIMTMLCVLYSILRVLGTSRFLGTNGNSSSPYGQSRTKIDMDLPLYILNILQKVHAK